MQKTILKIKVTPRSSKNEVKEFSEGVLKIRLTSPPTNGKANEHLVKFLAEIFDIKKSDIKIVSGFKSREKLIEICSENIKFPNQKIK